MAEGSRTAPPTARAFLADCAAVFPELSEPEFVARGGQGWVFRARGPDPFDGGARLDLAVKIFGLEAELAPDARRRTEAELRVAGALHGAIAASDDPRRHHLLRFARVLRGRWRDRELSALLAPFFAAGTLARWRRARPRDDAGEAGALRLATLTRLVQEVCAGLAFLHKQGYVHRDLKPSNVFLDGPADEPRAVLGDFGCTRLEGQATRMLSLDFAPTDPREDSGPAWDVCSLGFLVAWLVRGHLEPPFRERGRLSAAVLTRSKQAGLVAGADGRWYDDLTQLLLAATHNDPARRPRAEDFGRRIGALATAVARRAAHPPRRPLWVGLVLVGLLALAGGWLVRAQRFALPAGALWRDGFGLVWDAERARLCVARAPDSAWIALELAAPGPALEAAAFPGDAGTLAAWGEDWLAWIDPDGARAYGLRRGPDGSWLRLGDGLAQLPPGSPPARLLVPVAGRGLARACGSQLELWQLQGEGWVPVWLRPYAAPIEALEPAADGLSLRVLCAGQSETVQVGFAPPED